MPPRRVPCPENCPYLGPHAHYEQDFAMNFMEESPAKAPSADVCPNCGESQELAKIKGCIRCLKCGFKEDCNGW